MPAELDFTTQRILGRIAAIWDNVDGMDDFIAGLVERKRDVVVAIEDVRLKYPARYRNCLVLRLCRVSP